ncbi:MAG: pyridoxamine 5'-phosphate oxidase family protein [Thermoleophilaceae bacterium]|nr:pyridoxamine 5'-phosphate oxidase family protein [Thermoleophilaceae bacterium]
MKPAQTGQIDTRFSAPEAGPAPWDEVEAVLERAELYWISTVRADGRPHVTPLIAVLHDGALHFSTGLREQKAHNLEANPNVALTTGRNDSAGGVDVVVEGTAARIAGRDRLQAIADAVEAKYGSVWHFDVEGDDGFESVGGLAAVFRIDASKVLAFAKDPYAQTTFRF